MLMATLGLLGLSRFQWNYQKLTYCDGNPFTNGKMVTATLKEMTPVMLDCVLCDCEYREK